MKTLVTAIAAILLSAYSTACWAQGAVSQSGTVTKNHAAKFQTKGVISDAGPASGGNENVGISELPIVGLGKTLCLYDAPVTNAFGYHQLCLGANVDGNALLSLASGGGAITQNSFIIEINGVQYPFPGSVMGPPGPAGPPGPTGSGNITGPATSSVGHVPIFNNTLGTLLADAAANQFNVQATSGTATLPSLNNLYFPTYSQLAGVTEVTNLSTVLADTGGSFRDAVYGAISDSDAGVYSQSHSNYGGRFASFGPNNGGWLNTYKNIVGLNAYGIGATVGTGLATGFPPGVSGINADAIQYSAGIASNEFSASNPSAAGGSLAQSLSMAAVQAIVSNSYAPSDPTHTAFALLLTNTGSQMATAAIGASGPGTYKYFIQPNTAKVSTSGIVMPGSVSNFVGTIIDYGLLNGNPTGGSFTDWKGDILGGQYRWVDSNVVIGTLDTQGLVIYPKAGFDAYGAAPASGTGNIGYSLIGTWNDGINFNVTNFVDAAIVLSTSSTGSTIRYDATTYTNLDTGAYQIVVAGNAQIKVAGGGVIFMPMLVPHGAGLSTVCIDNATGQLFQVAGSC